jgi:hypothetical protein
MIPQITKHTLMESILQLLETHPWFSVASAVIAVASAISAVTPTPKSGTFLSKVYAVIDFLAINIGKAKSKGE